MCYNTNKNVKSVTSSTALNSLYMLATRNFTVWFNSFYLSLTYSVLHILDIINYLPGGVCIRYVKCT